MNINNLRIFLLSREFNFVGNFVVKMYMHFGTVTVKEPKYFLFLWKQERNFFFLFFHKLKSKENHITILLYILLLNRRNSLKSIKKYIRKGKSRNIAIKRKKYVEEKKERIIN